MKSRPAVPRRTFSPPPFGAARVVGEMVTMESGASSASSGNSAPVKKTYKRGGRGGESSSALVGGDEQIFAEQV